MKTLLISILALTSVSASPLLAADDENGSPAGIPRAEAANYASIDGEHRSRNVLRDRDGDESDSDDDNDDDDDDNDRDGDGDGDDRRKIRRDRS